MKTHRYLLILLTFFILLPNQSEAQETFANFEVLNRVLLVKYEASVDQKVKKELLTLFRGMRKKIEGFEWVHVSDLKESSQGFDQAITFTFASVLAYDMFNKHPDQELIKSLSKGNILHVESYEYWEKME